MKNLECLFKEGVINDNKLRIKISDEVVFRLENVEVTGNEIFAMIRTIASSNIKKVKIKFSMIRFNDGLVPHFLDLIIYYLLKNEYILEYNITIYRDKKQITGLDSYITTAINNYQNQYSKHYLNHSRRIYSEQKVHKKIKSDFLVQFEKSLIEKDGFLRVFIDRDKYDNDSSDIYYALERLVNFHKLSETIFLDLDDVLNEIIQNVIEKTSGDILINLFISDVLISATKENTKMLEVAIISLQESTLDEDVSTFYNKLKTESFEGMEESIRDSYTKLKKHYFAHEKLFDDFYTKKHFFSMSAFNERVSSREKAFGKAGGTGLPSLIDRIDTNKQVETGFSYVYSGGNIIWFRKNMMNLQNEIFSYNLENNIFAKPNTETYGNANYLPGIAYNLVFPL